MFIPEIREGEIFYYFYKVGFSAIVINLEFFHLYKWPKITGFAWGDFTLLIEVITPIITIAGGPPCWSSFCSEVWCFFVRFRLTSGDIFIQRNWSTNPFFSGHGGGVWCKYEFVLLVQKTRLLVGKFLKPNTVGSLYLKILRTISFISFPPVLWSNPANPHLYLHHWTLQTIQ